MPMTRLGGLSLAGMILVPDVAGAEPGFAPDMFDVHYYATDASGERTTEFGPLHHTQYLNQARCECGEAVQVEIRIGEPDGIDQTKLVQAFVGIMCAFAEGLPPGSQFRRCAEIASQPAANYAAAERVVNVHPVWLTNGVEGDPGAERDPQHALSAGTCAASQGQGGVWMCAQTDTIVGCQAEEFFLDPGNSERGPLHFDFIPPLATLTDVSAEAVPGGAEVRWVRDDAGDIFGFRVLCEETATGAAPLAGTIDVEAALTAEPTGEVYFNAHNLCGAEPFSSVHLPAPTQPPGDGSCGDGVRDAGEACDDGVNNAIDAMCTTDCTLTVSPSLYALDWDHVCSPHVTFTESSVIVEGLDGGKSYDMVLVTYDKFGNPKVYPRVLQVTPLPEDGCGCRSAGSEGLQLALVVAPLLRRRRRA